MHIPDGFLSPPVAIACAALSVAGLSAALVRAGGATTPRQAASIGVTAAFVFAAQMINFPVLGGTSGHLVGGVLASVLVGPSSAVLVMSAVLVLQCFLFGDGGLLSLGANVLNMAIVHPLVGFALYRTVIAGARFGRGREVAQIGGVAFAAWVATVASAGVCAGELALSNVVAPGVVLSAMLGVHAVIGAGEAAITASVIAAVIRFRPELLRDRDHPKPGLAPDVIAGLVVAAAVAVFVTPFACSWPDGLERVVERLGVAPSHAKVLNAAPLRDYAVPGLKGAQATLASALVGALLVFCICMGAGLWLAPKNRAPRDRTAGS
jgi:cobalt/nickel transport system permease protein